MKHSHSVNFKLIRTFHFIQNSSLVLASFASYTVAPYRPAVAIFISFAYEIALTVLI